MEVIDIPATNVTLGSVPNFELILRDGILRATPASTPQKKLAGEIKGANSEQPPQSPQKAAEMAQAELEKEGEMSEKQAELLLKSMKDEEQRVQLDERRVRRHVYNDW